MPTNSHTVRVPALFGRRFTAGLFALLAAVLTAPVARATTNVTDYFTPSGLTPGAPSGSYPLSGFESVNPYNGNLSFMLPLLRVGGRGTASYTMTLRSNIRWTVNQDFDAYGAPILTPTFNWWLPVDVGYGPGVMVGRQQVGEQCQLGDEPPGPYVTNTYTLTRLTFTAADGTEYELRDQKWKGQPKISQCFTNGNINYYGISRGKVFETTDGSAATFISDEEVRDVVVDSGGTYQATGILYLRDGTRYRIENGAVKSISDRNGNRLVFGFTSGGAVHTVDDSLGRRITIEYRVQEGAPYGLCDRITFRGFGNAERVIRISRTTLEHTLHPDYPLQTIYQLFGNDYPNASHSTYHNPELPSVVWLPGDTPETSRKYQLLYNSHGELAKVILPTGGAFEYVWGQQIVFPEIFRYVTERRVLADGNTLEGKTVYSRADDFSVNNFPRHYVDEAQYDQNNVLRAKTKHYYLGSPTASLSPGYQFSYSGWFEGKEYKTEQLNVVNGTPLRRIEHDWQQRAQVLWWRNPGQYGAPIVSNIEPALDPRINETKTTLLDSSQVTKQTYSYDRYNNKTDTYDYDYGAVGSGAVGPLVRRTNIVFMTTSTIGGVSYDYACDPSSSCLNESLSTSVIHQRSLPRVQTIYAVNSQTLAETPQTRIETRYDEAAYAPFTYDGITVPGWLDPATPARGNETSVRSFIDASATPDPDQPCPSGVCVETHTKYDQLGNVRKSWDARGNYVELTYLDSFCNDYGVRCDGTFTANTYAFPTRAEAPGPGAPYGTASALVSTAIYDFYTGLVYSTTNVNNKVTRYEYADSLDRLTAQVRPDGGRTDFYYSRPDEPYLFVRTLADLDAGREVKSEQHFDKLGRPARAFIWENQDTTKPWLTVDTFYDGLGREKKTTSRYRSTGPGSVANEAREGTETTFDALGRITEVKTTGDGSRIRNDYNGDRVLVTDQAEKQRMRRTDALGRLTDVWEITPNDTGAYPGIESLPSAATSGLLTSAYGYHTEYFYDAANKMRRVKQGGQQRFFAYDALGRLVRVRHPEQDTFTAGGDFPALSDNSSGANNEQWSSGYVYDANGNLKKRKDARGTVTTYGYDSLNRSTTVAYTLAGQTAATADVSRYYDNNATGANGIGRPWKSEALGTARTVVDKYDEMGRPAERTQQFWVNNNWGQAYTNKLTYNLAGYVTVQEYPSQHKVEYQYDIVGRLGDNGQSPAFKGTLGDATERTYASQILYDEQGGLSQERYATLTPLYKKHFYNVRGQLGEVRVSTYSITSTDASLRVNWNRGAIVNHFGGSDNNGNLRQQDVLIPNIEGAGYDQSGNFAAYTQSFEYDALNRLKRVAESSGQPWAQAYDYDRWGNRTINAGGTWLGQSSAQPDGRVNETQFEQAELQSTNRLYAPGDLTYPDPADTHRRMRYDAVGNLAHDSYTGAGTRAYDAENRMTSAQLDATQSAAYVYDADGRRVKRTAFGVAVLQVYGVGGELLAEYAPTALPSQPQKEYGYRSGDLLVTASAAAAGWGPAPDFYENPLNPNHPGETPIRSRHITELRTAIDALRSHMNLPGYGWQAAAGAGNPVTTAPLTEMRTALNEALGPPSGGYSTGLAQGQPIRAVHIQELRERLLNAWQSGTGSIDLRWLVTDQLGTPRMVINQTGSLAQVSRHDYLPFGEEIDADIGGRATHGYESGDGLRQHFTSKEHDDETGLDYFGARYYASWQGRFTSPDSLSSSAETKDPQTWNRYAYVTNNPLKYNDPTGEKRNPVTNRRGIDPVPANGIPGRIRSNRGNPHVGEYGMVRNNGTRPHDGTDINARKGTPLVAPESGTIQLRQSSSYGNQLIISTDKGETVSLNHLSSYTPGLRTGDRVTEGNVVAFSGDTGNAKGLTATNEDHVHLEVVGADGQQKDPVAWLNDPNADGPLELPGGPVVVLPDCVAGTSCTKEGPPVLEPLPNPEAQQHQHPPPTPRNQRRRRRQSD